MVLDPKSKSNFTFTLNSTRVQVDWMKIELEKKFTATSGEVTSRVAVVAGLGYHYARCYWELSKARLSMLVAATSGTGYIPGAGNAAIDFPGLCYTCVGTMMIATCANSLNQIFEISNDSNTMRTMQRPLPSGRISVSHATAWAIIVGYCWFFWSLFAG